jgi:excisionase family DNA binding protein
MYERGHLEKRPPVRTVSNSDDRILVGRREAARMLSISQRSIDYLVANKQLNVRRIGGRVLIPVNELRRYARADHPKPLARIQRNACPHPAESTIVPIEDQETK